MEVRGQLVILRVCFCFTAAWATLWLALSVCPLGLLVHLRCVIVRQGPGFLGPTREGRHCGPALLLVFSTYHPEGCLLAECVHMCVGLQVLTCVCQCTWQERGGKIASERCSRCQPGLQGCTRSHPVTFGRWDAVFHSPNPGSLQVALVSGHSCTTSTVVVNVMYCVPAPAWRGAEPASPLPHQHWSDCVWRQLWGPLGIHVCANSKVWLT